MRWPLAVLLASAGLGVPMLAQAAPLSLDELVKAALLGHPSVASARETASAGAFRARGATSPYWPQVSVSTGTSMTTQVSNAQNTAAPFALSSIGASARQQLWDFGKTADEVSAAEAGADGSRLLSEMRRVDIAYGVRKAYLDWMRARGLQTQVQAQQQSANALLQQANAFWAAGRRSKLDVTRADAGLQQARAEVIAARNAAQVALLALGAATGRNGGVEAQAVFPPLPTLVSASMSDLRERAKQHPLVRQSAARLRQTEANHRRADKANWPDITADVNYGLRARDLTPNQNWGAGVNMSVPVFNGFADWRDRNATAADARASAADVQNQLLQVTLGIETASMAREGARERLAAVGAVVRSAEANLLMAEGRYRTGLGTVIDVSDAQTLLKNAQADHIRAEADYHLAIADLLRAVGITGVES